MTHATTAKRGAHRNQGEGHDRTSNSKEWQAERPTHVNTLALIRMQSLVRVRK